MTLVRAAPVVVMCAVVWLLLQGEWSFANVFWGIVLGVGLAVFFPVDRHAPRHRLRPWGLIRLVGYVLRSLVVSSWAVIKTVLRPTPANLRAGILRIELEHDSPLTTALVGNSITLTPGTMTLTAVTGPSELHVHVLGLADPDEFRASILDLERRVVAAFEPHDRVGSGVADADAEGAQP